MTVSFYNLQVVKCIHELGSIHATAQQLFVSPSAVSHQLTLLEQYFGFRLFERRGRRMVITHGGELVYAHAVRLLDEFLHLEVDIKDFQAARIGEIVAGGSIVPGTYWIPQVISVFRKSHPQVQVKLQVFPTEELGQAVIDGRVDLGVTPVKYQNPFLTIESLGTEEIVIVAAPDIPLRLLPKNLEELSQRDFICAPHETLGRKNLDERLTALGISRRNVVMEIGHPEGVKHAVRAGMGLGMVYRWSVAEDLDRGILQSVKVDGFSLFMPIYLLRRTGQCLSPICQHFIATLFHEIQRDVVLYTNKTGSRPLSIQRRQAKRLKGLANAGQ